MEMIKKKKGFTLIELMIVLAIIAILAVVLIPKSQIFKNNSKNAGVITNVNTVRAYLETKVTNTSGINAYLTTADLTSAFAGAFNTGSSSTDKLINPFTNISGAGIGYAYEIISAPTTDSSISSATTEANVKADAGSSFTGKKGEVIVVVYSNGYGVVGIDSGESATQAFIVQ
ncbi:type II secretion system protein [Clostridium sp. WILCCON 0269]|uniref:Type II secretion system protein n=1 Tax=Candidatus Clostridium eludens TaxID=3381663 RepID=A0ABW8SI44_9CLOT